MSEYKKIKSERNKEFLWMKGTGDGKALLTRPASISSHETAAFLCP